MITRTKEKVTNIESDNYPGTPSKQQQTTGDRLEIENNSPHWTDIEHRNVVVQSTSWHKQKLWTVIRLPINGPVEVQPLPRTHMQPPCLNFSLKRRGNIEESDCSQTAFENACFWNMTAREWLEMLVAPSIAEEAKYFNYAQRNFRKPLISPSLLEHNWWV